MHIHILLQSDTISCFSAEEEKMEIVCSGTPYEIGLHHGQKAQVQIRRCIAFYVNLFRETSKLEWAEVCKVALKFLPSLESKWPEYVEEIRGVSKGAGFDFPTILALNVRTEIAYGLFNDGCTALSWKTDGANGASFLAQNWDWQHEQKENLVSLRIHQPPKPTITMITEAGIIGKIGLNSAGVGVTLNAIKAAGVDYDRLPVHLSLRRVLDSPSRDEAVAALGNAGVSSACHLLVADSSGGLGLECSSTDIVALRMEDGKVTHTNHYLASHGIVQDMLWLPDSPFRLARIRELVAEAEAKGEGPTTKNLGEMFKDEKNYPGSICRAEAPGSTVATLFNIVMDLKAKMATVQIGRPIHSEGVLLLDPTT
ncbi:AAT-domain-containing protein [Xylona heveae TC161]|uniref:AAT-domain-containing protein n=1 Tax=Xylona heveae (strain CBS 132557 / TC161) TaxID=1328760 RepID=A0A165IWP8_XYLHT|nr:AAT-domain-containing protein [Xylona heveae TC161]KZF25480.1 AAT-domain-containing protein [Xylona heveae TC161]